MSELRKTCRLVHLHETENTSEFLEFLLSPGTPNPRIVLRKAVHHAGEDGIGSIRELTITPDNEIAIRIRRKSYSRTESGEKNLRIGHPFIGTQRDLDLANTIRDVVGSYVNLKEMSDDQAKTLGGLIETAIKSLQIKEPRITR